MRICEDVSTALELGYTVAWGVLTLAGKLLLQQTGVRSILKALVSNPLLCVPAISRDFFSGFFFAAGGRGVVGFVPYAVPLALWKLWMDGWGAMA